MPDPATPPPSPGRETTPPFVPGADQPERGVPFWQHRLRRRRPPWWPEGEPWPPQPGSRWRTGRQFRGRYVLSALVFLLTAFVVTVGGSTLCFWLVVGAIQGGPFEGGPFPHGLGPIWRFVPVPVLFIGGLLLFLMLRAVSRVTRPVDDFMEAVARVADGDFAARVAERGPRETRRLARAFNTMTERLEANEAKRRSLLADVTHELRTPLTVIQGNLEGLLDGVYPADAPHLTPILDETRVLARLIDDLRTLAEAESGTLALHREPTDLGVLCGETAAAFRQQAAAAGVALTLDVADDLPIANVDPLRLREVLTNLVANALRYTPAGGTITLRGRVPQPSGPAEPRVLLEVADTGAGIEPERLPHIFDRFYKSPDSRGSGLGLAIAKNLVTAHGGDLTARSTPGAGTTMQIRLPIE